MKLYKHQVDFLKKNINKTTLVWSCGTGKSITALEWTKRSEKPILVICPKALKNNWEREAEKCGVTCTVMKKEQFRSEYNDLFPFGQIIVDEVHNGFLTPNFKSAMSKALRAYIRKHSVPRVLLLSATVYSSSPWNIYSLAYFTGHNWNWHDFSQAFFVQVRMGNRIVPVVREGIEERLSQAVKNIASVVDISECIDVPEQLHLEPEWFALSKKQNGAIKENYDPLPIVRYTNQHEIENGILIGNEFVKPRTFECDKNERLLALVEENDKIAIVCRYNMQIDEISKLLAQYKPLIIRGSVKNRDEITLQAESAEKCVVIIQADCAEGYNLPSFGLCVFMSQSYSYVKYEQICGRFLRINKPSRTTFMYLLTEGKSIDKAVYDSVKKKEDFSISLYDKN